MAHTDLWKQLWGQRVLLGDSVSVQWVPSHVGVHGNEHADLNAGRWAKAAKHAVIARVSYRFGLTFGCRKCLTAMTWTQNVSGGSGLSDSDCEMLSEWSGSKAGSKAKSVKL